MTTIALATCAEIPDLDTEGRLALHALQRAGATVEAAVWDDPDVAWERFDAVVVRSTWDYTTKRTAFLAWAGHVEEVSELYNPAAVLRWNSDKHYLHDLSEAGIPVVPSAFLEPGDRPTAHPFAEVDHVVKPAVGAGSLDAARHQPGSSASTRHIERLLAQGRSVITQPYLNEVDTQGESALLYFAGAFAHSLRKAAILTPGRTAAEGALFIPEEMTPRAASAAERDLADGLLHALPGILTRRDITLTESPLYARVDLLPSAEGPLLLELELTEPSLFLDHAPGSAERFASAVLTTLSRRWLG